VKTKIPLNLAAQARAMADMGMEQKKIADATGINQRTVSAIARGDGRWGEILRSNEFFKKYLEEQKRKLHVASMELSERALEQVEKKIDKASAYQAAGIYGLLRTHGRLDAGESTENLSVHHRHEIEGLDKLGALLSQSLLPNNGSGASQARTFPQKPGE
jgi:transcriptional regulator with XRE-family HTH domain